MRPAGKDEGVRFAAFEHGQFKIAVERRGGYGLPLRLCIIGRQPAGALIEIEQRVLPAPRRQCQLTSVPSSEAILLNREQSSLAVLRVQKLRLDHSIEQGSRCRKLAVIIALQRRDEHALLFDPAIAISDMALNIGKQFQVLSEFVLFRYEKHLQACPHIRIALRPETIPKMLDVFPRDEPVHRETPVRWPLD
jgi:hypothetical protein